MTPELYNIIFGAVAALLGYWFRHWQGGKPVPAAGTPADPVLAKIAEIRDAAVVDHHVGLIAEQLKKGA